MTATATATAAAVVLALALVVVAACGAWFVNDALKTASADDRRAGRLGAAVLLLVGVAVGLAYAAVVLT